MSAFVVSTAHIDTIVSAAIELELFAARTDHGTLEWVCHETATAFGQMLLAENVRSVVHRYRLIGSTEASDYAELMETYEFRYRPCVRAGVAAKALDCFDYQSCETDNYETSLACGFSKAREIGPLLLNQLPVSGACRRKFISLAAATDPCEAVFQPGSICRMSKISSRRTPRIATARSVITIRMRLCHFPCCASVALMASSLRSCSRSRDMFLPGSTDFCVGCLGR
ncbi:hypothetical protein BB934_31035 (plasmid) [Microvirga ossetica]|uniref:Uncharacterized protein n=1 Tax=Microvirga ossetica TaxID=1882682 RepID=A0A1B2ERT9_9HYPH|nr:hypothetical protein BB934_31035 [Microvirga ossetica]